MYDPPDAATGVTSTPTPGEVRFDPRATLPTLGGPDISVTTDTLLMMSFEGAVPLPVVVSDVSIPITSLLTILHGADCQVRLGRIGRRRERRVEAIRIDPGVARS